MNFIRCFILVAALMPVAASAVEFVVVDSAAKVPPAPIIFQNDAPPFTRQAAVELVGYIEKISGSRPELIESAPQQLPERAIWIGASPDAELDFKHPEEILITANENHLVIAGRDVWDPDHLVVEGKRETVNGVQSEYGTANAIYAFIHDYLDVRWLWPGESGEEFDKRDRIAFEPFEYRYHPQLRARSKVLSFSVVLKHSAYGQSGNWARRQRIQYVWPFGLAPLLNLNGCKSPFSPDKTGIFWFNRANISVLLGFFHQSWDNEVGLMLATNKLNPTYVTAAIGS